VTPVPVTRTLFASSTPCLAVVVLTWTRRPPASFTPGTCSSTVPPKSPYRPPASRVNEPTPPVTWRMSVVPSPSPSSTFLNVTSTLPAARVNVKSPLSV
jgi:hypothetical protein